MQLNADTPTKFRSVEVPLDVEWTDMRVSVPGKGRGSEPIELLHGLNGYAGPGELVAVMGPSGAGKTTFLNLLSDRSKVGVTGSLLLNGKPKTSSAKRLIGYVMQKDIFFEHLSVYDTLKFTALMRLPSDMPTKEKLKRVDEVIHELGLWKCRHTIVGSSVQRGISGGELKRLNIANELLFNPSLFLLDEPTSGLDSSSAFALVSTLKAMALASDRLIISSIHQPNSQIFAMFDRLILFCGGHIVFQGSAANSLHYFDALGYKCPLGYNMADFLMDVLNDPQQTDRLVDAYRKRTRRTPQGYYESVPLHHGGPSSFGSRLSPIVSPSPGKPFTSASPVKGTEREQTEVAGPKSRPPPLPLTPSAAPLPTPAAAVTAASSMHPTEVAVVVSPVPEESREVEREQEEGGENREGHCSAPSPLPSPRSQSAPSPSPWAKSQNVPGSASGVGPITSPSGGPGEGLNLDDVESLEEGVILQTPGEAGHSGRIQHSKTVDEMVREHVKRPSWGYLVWVLWMRGLKTSPGGTLTFMAGLQSALVAAVVGVMWFQNLAVYSEGRLEDRLGALFFITVYNAFVPMFNALTAFPAERAVISKERASKTFPVSAYFSAKTLTDLPVQLAFPFLFMLIAYPLIGLPWTAADFLGTTLIILTCVTVANSVGLLVSALVTDFSTGATVCA
eukprot:Cvel_10596.t1-p1 / transcript=Cvel_10596.t1 / gene=Cvel_10596 / organism=Chromera_velia_CCMP2878 / gene_product=ABC transporter G family member 14, putative / transcript_product=ABC transporter G family member 14, putative / location=Cvel_scaffold642:71517-75091(+) / protein_length=675 / sequence_SO=supercontig / SO=protein_coding / is_pseudo=false